MPVYQSPNALFSTADLHPRLLKPDQQVIMQTWLHTQKGWLTRNDVLKDIDFSQTGLVKADTAVRARPDGTLAPQSWLKTQSKVEILERSESWIKIKSETANGWVSEENLTSNPFDRGFVLTKKATSIFIAPQIKSKKLSTIQAGMKFKPLSIHGSWILIKHQGVQGWLIFDDVFSKLDFALRLISRNSKAGWQTVITPAKTSGHKYQPSGPWLKVDKSWFALSQIKGLQTDPRKTIVAPHGAVARTLPSLARSVILTRYRFGETLPSAQPSTVTWLHMNSIDGSIWWPLYPAGAKGNRMLSDQELTTAELFERPIYDLSESPNATHLKVVSSRGIYKTSDDKNWHKLNFFGSKNFPVAFSPKGELYVGPYRSHDQGHSFTPFLRWDRVLANISRHQMLVPQNLRLTKIEFKEGRPDIFITVNSTTSKNNFILSSSDDGQHWIDVSGKKPRRFDFARGLSMNAE
jgi:SH3-like domain-containing protein